MKTEKLPFGLLGLVVMFWAWSVDMWPLGILLAFLLESPKITSWRYQIEDHHLGRIFKLIFLLTIFLLVVLFSVHLTNGIYLFVKWIPIIILPIILIQLYHENEKFPLHVLIKSFKKKQTYAVSVYPKNIDLTLFYTLLLLVSVSISTKYFIGMFAFFFVVIVICIHFSHPKNMTYIKLSLLTCLTLVLAISIQSTLIYLQEITAEWLVGDWSQTNVFQSKTAIGEIGSLKLSNKIIMRIHASEKRSIFLRQASYSLYNDNSWFMQPLNFTPLKKLSATNTWLLTKSNLTPSKNKLIVSSVLKERKGILAVPVGTTGISLAQKGRLSKNGNNSIRIENTEKLLDFTAYYDSTLPINSTPGLTDLNIPAPQKKLIENLVMTLELTNLSVQDALVKVEQYFKLNFRYSLVKNKDSGNMNPLDYFLNTSHKGHCEYFATAGALILRALNIPTRYVTGFLMTEFDSSKEQYIVRQRHSHAWVQAYVDNEWVELDYTPSLWADLEAENEPWWQGIIDSFDYQYNKLHRWWGDKNNEYIQLIIILVSGVSLFFYVRRLNMKKSNLNWQRVSSNSNTEQLTVYGNTNSPFNTIIHYLEQHIDKRAEGETITTWVNRIELKIDPKNISLKTLITRHYSIVYGKKSLSESERLNFSTQVNNWLNKERSNQ